MGISQWTEQQKEMEVLNRETVFYFHSVFLSSIFTALCSEAHCNLHSFDTTYELLQLT